MAQILKGNPLVDARQAAAWWNLSGPSNQAVHTLPELAEFPSQLEPAASEEGSRNPVIELDQLKSRLLEQELGHSTDVCLRTALQRAADEAASLAWMTPFPLLFLPGLLEEKLTEAWQRHQLQCAIQVRSRAMFRRSGLARQLAWAGAHLSSWWPSPTATPARRGECQPRDDRETLEFEAAAPMASTRRR